LVDFLIFSVLKLQPSHFFLSAINYYCTNTSKLNYTLSKGVLVRKKQSREQFAFQQNFFYINQRFRILNLNFLHFNFNRSKLFLSNYLTLSKLSYCNFILPFLQTSIFFVKKKILLIPFFASLYFKRFSFSVPSPFQTLPLVHSSNKLYLTYR
jgi:hypothetical protein